MTVDDVTGWPAEVAADISKLLRSAVGDALNGRGSVFDSSPYRGKFSIIPLKFYFLAVPLPLGAAKRGQQMTLAGVQLLTFGKLT